MERHRDRHAVLEESGALADEILGQFDLFVAVQVHEHEALALTIKELKIAPLEMGFFHPFVGAEAMVELAPVDQIFQLDLILGWSLAGFDRHGLDRDPERAEVLDHHAGTDFAAVELGHAGGSGLS